MYNETFLNAAIMRAFNLASVKKEVVKTNRETRSHAISGELPVIKITSVGKVKGNEHVFNKYLPIVPAMTAGSVNAFTVTSLRNNMDIKKHKAEFVTSVTMHTYGKEKDVGILFAYDNGNTVNGNWKSANFNTVVRKASISSAARASHYGFDIEASNAYFETVKKWYELFEHDYKAYDSSRNLKWTHEVGFGIASYQGANENVAHAFSFAVFDIDNNGRKFIKREYIFMGDVILLFNRTCADSYAIIKDKKGDKISAISNRQTIKINAQHESKNVLVKSMVETDIDQAIKTRKSNGRIKQEIEIKTEINPFIAEKVEQVEETQVETAIELVEQAEVKAADIESVVETAIDPVIEQIIEEVKAEQIEEEDMSVFKKNSPEVKKSIFGKTRTLREEAALIDFSERAVEEVKRDIDFNEFNPMLPDQPAPINASIHFDMERV